MPTTTPFAHLARRYESDNFVITVTTARPRWYAK